MNGLLVCWPGSEQCNSLDSLSSVQKFAVPDVTEDPFDCIFGYNGVPEETSRIDNQNNLTKRQARSNRRAHRRRHRSQNQ